MTHTQDFKHILGICSKIDVFACNITFLHHGHDNDIQLKNVINDVEKKSSRQNKNLCGVNIYL